MRQFFIQNEYGERIELQGGSIFLWEPSGLGFSDNVEYMEADGFFIETYREQAQLEKVGTLVFKPSDAYKNYYDFANWIFAAQKLTLGYNPFGDWFYIDVAINQMDKSELTLAGVLEIPIVYTPLTQWYTPLDLNLTIDGIMTDNVKMYTYTYPYRYTNSARAGILDFTVQAQVSSDFRISIPGPVQSPIITATRIDTDTVIGKIDLSTVSAEEGETIQFTNVPSEAGASLATSSGTQDLTAQLGLDSSAPTFFKLPPNVPIEFALTATSLVGVSAYLQIYRYFRTV